MGRRLPVGTGGVDLMVDESGRLLAGEPVGVGVSDASSDLADPITVGGRCLIKPLGAVWVECGDPPLRNVEPSHLTCGYIAALKVLHIVTG